MKNASIPYAVLDAADVLNGNVTCTIKTGSTTVGTVAGHLQTKLAEIVSSDTAKTKLSKVQIGAGTLSLGGDVVASDIITFVKAALPGVTSGTKISTLAPITAKVTDKNGNSFDYTITFVLESQAKVNELITSNISTLNGLMKVETVSYATLNDLTGNTVDCSVHTSAVTVGTVAGQLKTQLANLMKGDVANEYISTIKINDSTLTISESVDASAIIAFVKGAGLKTNSSTDVSTTTPIGELCGTSITAKVTDKSGCTFDYIITFTLFT